MACSQWRVGHAPNGYDFIQGRIYNVENGASAPGRVLEICATALAARCWLHKTIGLLWLRLHVAMALG